VEEIIMKGVIEIAEIRIQDTAQKGCRAFEVAFQDFAEEGVFMIVGQREEW